ncbi:hypothetical protein ARMGADRAFT_1090497 [Armillaria gallica]|uniref:LSM domain-containing protein n=1 Tax=Armillaria gallica TaxID=47427 RepID=A0A2H3D449_ARMGA|nr:hypothetical protein ARMGADRAFT_1090497 [Armillaria gallica]
MSSLPAGTRIFFYNSNGRLTGGIVESTSAMENGMQIVIILFLGVANLAYT